MADEHLQQRGDKQHAMQLSHVRTAGNGHRVRVRCTCMAEYRNTSRRYFNYDALADAANIEHARAVFTIHLAIEAVR